MGLKGLSSGKGGRGRQAGTRKKPSAEAIEGIIAQLRPELEASSEALGAILHGSHAQGTAREDSDVDVLCVISADWYSKAIRLINGFEVEIQRTPHEQVRLDLERFSKPFTVRAFANCRILFDRDGSIEKLIRKARKLWEDGAPPPSQTEILFGKSYLRHHLEELERLVRDPGGNRVSIEGVLAESFLMVLRAHFRARSRWMNKASSALEELRETDPEFWSLADRYTGTRDLGERVALMRSMVDRALEPVGPLVVEYETPRVPAQFAVLRGEGEAG